VKHAVLIAALVLLAGAAGCAPKVKRTPDQAVRVNGEWVLAGDIEQVTRMLREQILARHPEASLAEGTDRIRRDAARQLIANRLLQAEAQKRGLAVSDSLVQRAWDALRKRYGGDERFAQEIAKAGQTEAKLRANMREGLMIDTLLKGLLAQGDSVPQAQCRIYYDQNAARFTSPGRMRARQILLRLDSAAGAAQVAQAQARAEGLRAAASAGKDFGELARRNSQDASAAKGGDIGWFKPGDLMPALDRAVVPLAKGEVSGIVRTTAGFHILQKTDMSAPQRLTFEEVEGQILAMLEMKARAEFVQNHIDSLVRVARVEYFDSAYAPQENTGNGN
jgi:peptidyl-prolyl cis-trans isomerase C